MNKINTQFIPAFMIRPHNKLHTEEKQPEQSSHIRKRIIDLNVLLLDAEILGRLVHLDVDELAGCGAEVV